MKEYNKFMRKVSKLSGFELVKSPKRTTVKLVHTESGELYSIHPADHAVRPLKKWINKFVKI